MTIGMKTYATVLFAGCLLGCASQGNDVRVTSQKPVPVSQVPIAKPRSEPVFYNGKTYHLDLVPETAGIYALSVKGMTGDQKKDAIAVATSSLRYFACPDGQTGILNTQPAYGDRVWRMSAHCG